MSWFKSAPPAYAPSPPSVTYDANGNPRIEWHCQERNVRNMEGWFDKRLYHDLMEAKVSLAVEYEGNLHWRCQGLVAARIFMDDTKGAEIGKEKSRVAHPTCAKDFYTLRSFGGFRTDSITRFTMRQASEMELSAMELAAFRAGRLNFLEHHCIVAEFSDGGEKVFSRDCYVPQYARQVVVLLNNEIVRKRPEGGWRDKVARDEAENEKAMDLKSAIKVKTRMDVERSAEVSRVRSERLSEMPPDITFAGIIFASPETFQRNPAVVFPLNDPPVKVSEYGSLAAYERIVEIDPRTDVKHRASIAEMWTKKTLIVGASIARCMDNERCVSDYVDRVQVDFNSNGANWLPDIIAVRRVLDVHGLQWIKPMSDLRDIKIVDGKSVPVPPQFLIRLDVVTDDDALILCLVFSKGELVPLSYTTQTSREDLEKWKELLLMGWKKQSGVGVAPPVSSAPDEPISASHRPV